MATPNPKQPQQRHSRLIYGSNAAMLAIIAAALVIAVNFLFSKTTLRTRSFTGVSLSPSTLKLLKELDSKTKGNYTIANLFEAKFPTKARTDDEQQKAENARAVSDLLREYGRNSTHIQVISPGTRDDVEVMIKERFATEETIIRTALNDLEKLLKDLETFSKQEGENFSALAQQKADEMTMRAAVDLRLRFTDRIPASITDARRIIERETNATLPRWNMVVNLAGVALADIDENLKGFTDIFEEIKKSKSDKNTPPAVARILDHIVEIAPAVTKHRDGITEFLKRLEGLPTSKLSINLPQEPSIVIFPPPESKEAKEIQIITRDKMFSSKRAGQNTTLFEGEGPVSTAILPLVRPDKVKVLFVGSNAEFIQSSFSEVSERLKESNFAVDVWTPIDPREMAQMDPRRPMPPLTPQYAGKGVVWVVFAAEPSMMPPGQKDQLTEEIIKHMNAGGSTMFLASPGASTTVTVETGPETQLSTTQPSTSTQPTTQPATRPTKTVKKFIYQDLIEKFGIQVEPGQFVVSSFKKTDERGVVFNVTSGMVTVDEFPDDVITEPIQSLRAGFGLPMPDRTGNYNTMFLTSIVRAVKTSGAASSEIVLIPPANDTFFPTDRFTPGVNWINENREVSAEEEPTAASKAHKGPFPIAAKGVIDAGPDEKRVVVVGNLSWAHTAIVEYSDLVQRPNGLMRVSNFPGNSELFVNSVMWLAKDENRIAVSANAGTASRIKVSPAAKRAIDWTLLYTGLPLLALLAGGIVWKIRRR